MGGSLSETKTPAIAGTTANAEAPAFAGTAGYAGELALEEVRAICSLLEDHKGGDVAALDLRELNLWTDFFIIATVSSGTHLQGLLRHIKDFADSRGLAVRHHRKNNDSSGWNLVDMGTAVVHLMSPQCREFYGLEELWSSAKRIYPEPKSAFYSSKSS
jgi:ribosome-associated protein